jgi:hypothetical protein
MRARSAAVLTALALAAVVANSALAATTWTVKPGGPTELSAKFGAGFTGPNVSRDLDCSVSDGRLDLKKGSGLDAARIGHIASLTFSSCSGATFTGLPKVTVRGLPYAVNFVSQTHGTTRATKGTITGFEVSIIGPGCSAYIGGPAGRSSRGELRFLWGAGVLFVYGTLHIWDIKGCTSFAEGSFANNGDRVGFASIYTVGRSQTIAGP